MFAWIQQLLSAETVETEETARCNLRQRMQRETEGLLNYQLGYFRTPTGKMARARPATSRQGMLSRKPLWDGDQA